MSLYRHVVHVFKESFVIEEEFYEKLMRRIRKMYTEMIWKVQKRKTDAIAPVSFEHSNFLYDAFRYKHLFQANYIAKGIDLYSASCFCTHCYVYYKKVLQSIFVLISVWNFYQR